jgi:hypothetical protein
MVARAELFITGRVFHELATQYPHHLEKPEYLEELDQSSSSVNVKKKTAFRLANGNLYSRLVLRAN